MGELTESQTKIILSLATVLILIFLRALVIRLIVRRIDDKQKRYAWRKTTTYTAVIIGIFLIGRMWFEGFQSLATYAGLLSAGVAIALRDVIANIAGWMFIVSRRPFAIGDRIQIGDHAGDVVDVTLFHFTIMEIGNWVRADQKTGRVVNIPNSLVLREALANYSKGFQFIWNEIPVLITFESDWKKAKEIFQRIVAKHAGHLTEAAERKLKEASERFMVPDVALAPSVFTTVVDSGVLLTIRYLCEPTRRRETEQAIWEDVLNELAKCDDIDLAYPTQRFYNNRLEGKPGTRRDAADEGARQST